MIVHAFHLNSAHVSIHDLSKGKGSFNMEGFNMEEEREEKRIKFITILTAQIRRPG